jgi:anti-sigma-K factor RskA
VNAPDLRELLPGYVAGELLPDDQERVRAALARSPELRAELERYQQVFLLFAAAALDEMQIPAGLSTRIARQVTLQFYLKVLTNITTDLFGFYGRALAFYLGLR